MCHVISDHCGCKAKSSGASVQTVAVLIGGLAAVSVAYQVMEAAWLPLLLLYFAVVAFATKWSRRQVWRLLKWLVREMWRSWTTRHDRPSAGQALMPGELTWRFTLSASTADGTVALHSGTVAGTWPTAALCQAAIIDEALRAYAEADEDPPGQLCCRAEPVVGLAR